LLEENSNNTIIKLTVNNKNNLKESKYMKFLFTLHSHNRWLLFTFMGLTLIMLLYSWLKKEETLNKFTKISKSILSALWGLQVLIGVTLWLVFGFSGFGWPMHRTEHFVTMIIAFFVFSFSSKWKQSEVPIYARNTLFLLIASLALVAIAITRLPQGWAITKM
jgi:hypothetical protein